MFGTNEPSFRAGAASEESASAAPRDRIPGGAKSSRWLRWLGYLAGVVVIVAGFLGLDGWFYSHVSQVLNPPDRPLGPSVYISTRWFWLACRWAFGYGLAGLAVCVVVVVLEPRRWRAVFTAIIAVAIAALAANIAQGAIGRLRPNQGSSPLAFTRPFAELLNKENVSFPSGEAATAFALACALTRLLPRGRPVFYAAGVLAAVARLANGAHYVSDVVAGALVGVLIADFVSRWLNRYEAQRT